MSAGEFELACQRAREVARLLDEAAMSKHLNPARYAFVQNEAVRIFGELIEATRAERNRIFYGQEAGDEPKL